MAKARGDRAHEDRGTAIEEPESCYAWPAEMMPGKAARLGAQRATDKIYHHVDRVGATGGLRCQAQDRALIAIHGGLDPDIEQDYSQRKDYKRASGQHEHDKRSRCRHGADGNRECGSLTVSQIARERRARRARRAQ